MIILINMYEMKDKILFIKFMRLYDLFIRFFTNKMTFLRVRFKPIFYTQYSLIQISVRKENTVTFVTGFAECFVAPAHFLYIAEFLCDINACCPNSSLRNCGKLRGDLPSAVPVTGSTYRSRDPLANARSDYRGELIATDRETHWRRCSMQPSVAFLLR